MEIICHVIHRIRAYYEFRNSWLKTIGNQNFNFPGGGPRYFTFSWVGNVCNSGHLIYLTNMLYTQKNQLIGLLVHSYLRWGDPHIFIKNNFEDLNIAYWKLGRISVNCLKAFFYLILDKKYINLSLFSTFRYFKKYV